MNSDAYSQVEFNGSDQRQKAMVALVLLWSLLPCLTIWVGLTQCKSALLTYFLYHYVCLLPAIILGRKLWANTFLLPKRNDLIILTVVSLLFSGGALIGYELFGGFLLSNEHSLIILREYIGSKNLLLALAAYAVIVNPLFEEIFWRGIVFNALDKSRIPIKHFGIIWSSCAYAALHYLIFSLVLFPLWAEVLTVAHVFYGGLLAVVYRRTGSILTAAIAHGLLTDLAFIVVAVDLFRLYPNFLSQL